MTTETAARPAGDMYDSPEQARQQYRDILRLWSAITLLSERLESQAREIADLKQRLGDWGRE